ncbi:BglG family transcription antiterminator [Aerococcaceae bacterium WGS1372]
MFLTDRERHILSILLSKPTGVKVNELIELLNVSRRTVYRELSNLEETLTHSNVSLVNQRTIGYQLEGKPEDIQSIQYLLETDQVSEMTIQERHRAVSLRLLLSCGELTMDQLAEDLMVSASTIQSDLDDVEDELKRHGIYINRMKFQGIKVIAPERKRREIASRLIYGSVLDYDFFKYLTILEEDKEAQFNDKFLSLITSSALYYAMQAINHDFNHLFEKVTDNQLQLVLIILALSIDRIRQGYHLDEAISAKHIAKDMVLLSHEIFAYVSAEIELPINMNERHFIAMQLEGLNYKTSQSIFFESFDSQLAYQVKELIRKVSLMTGNDYRYDDSLFYNLVAHIQATLKRPVLMDYKLDTPVLKRISEEYSNLSLAINLAWEEVFQDNDLTNDEKAYIVIHFATSLERFPITQREINTIIISSSGVGTGKILESRLKRYLPEINTVTVVQLSKLNQVDFSNYQLILSTIYLSGMSRHYRVISPLLSDEEIEAIRRDIQRISEEEDTSNNQLHTQLYYNFDDYYTYFIQAKKVLDAIQMKQVKAQPTLELTLELMVQDIGLDYILDSERVTKEVIDRYQKAPIGVPQSKIALFHSSNEWVKAPYFSVYEIDQSFEVLAMDGGTVQLCRILLMVAPEQMTKHQQQLLGLISSSIIESDINTSIYESGSQEQIKQLISSLFVKEIQYTH